MPVQPLKSKSKHHAKKEIVIPADKRIDKEIKFKLKLTKSQEIEIKKLLSDPNLAYRLKVFLVEGSDIKARMQIEPTKTDDLLAKWRDIFYEQGYRYTH